MLMLQHVLHETQEACKCSADFSQSDVNVFLQMSVYCGPCVKARSIGLYVILPNHALHLECMASVEIEISHACAGDACSTMSSKQRTLEAFKTAAVNAT